MSMYIMLKNVGQKHLLHGKKNDPGHCRSNCQPRVRREFRNVPFLPDNVYYKIKKLSKLTGLPKIVCFPDFHLNPSPVI